MKYLLILGACLLALSGCYKNDNAKFEYAVACKALQDTELACGDLPVPAVEYFDAESDPSTLGYYTGGYTIYIADDGLSFRQESAVKFHEIIHYLQVHRGGLELPGPASLVCAAEAMAFELTDEYRAHIGLGPVGDGWWRPYWYCWQFYAPEGSKMIILKLPDGEIMIDIME